MNTFASFGWEYINHAYTYTFFGGSYVDYALKKIKSSLNINPKIKEQTQIDLVVLDLPSFIRYKIDRDETETTDALMS